MATDRWPAEHARTSATAGDAAATTDRAATGGPPLRRSHRHRGRPAVDCRGCSLAARWFCSLRRSQRPQRSPTPSRENAERNLATTRIHRTGPQFSAAEQNAAKQQLCHIFDISARGQRGQGGMRVNGEVNVPLLLRTVNSVIAVENALTPAVPKDLAR